MIRKVNLAEKLAAVEKHWTPTVVGELNGQYVKVVRIQGEFAWHHHDAEDELFWVLDGEMELHFRDRVLTLRPGEFCIVPRGVEHKPVAANEAHIALFEPASTRNTGNVTEARTIETADLPRM